MPYILNVNVLFAECLKNNNSTAIKIIDHIFKLA